MRVDGKLHLPTVATISGLTYQTVYGYVMKQGYLAAQVAETDADGNMMIEVIGSWWFRAAALVTGGAICYACFRRDSRK